MDVHLFHAYLPDAISKLVNLESLRLVHCEIGDMDRSLSRLTKLSQLVIINISDPGWSDEPGMDQVEGIDVPKGILKAMSALKDVHIEAPWDPQCWCAWPIWN